MKQKFSLHNLLLTGLSILILGKLLFRFDIDFLSSFLLLSATAWVWDIITKRRFSWDIALKNTLIYVAILLLLVSPTSSLMGLLTLFGVAVFGLIIRNFVRYQGKPILNPAVSALFWLALLTQFAPASFPIDIFTSWHGVNYQFWVFPFATIVSFLLVISLTIGMKKYWYALWFFLIFVISGYFLLDYATVQSALLDGTLYFFFWVMASEPKTGPSGNKQWLFWGLLALILVLFLKYQIFGDYISALAAINLIYFTYQYFFTQKNHLTTEMMTSYPKGQKWLCVPCGYIYDPMIGDLDSGIIAGTEFSDIPDSWRCPVCGVTKSDFLPLTEEYGEAWSLVNQEYEAIIVARELLNPTTLAFTIQTTEPLESQPGQFIGFLWEDATGKFSRSYSIVKSGPSEFSFIVKLTEDGRGSQLLRASMVWMIIRIRWVFGRFVLQNTKAPKIFIATGTGLSPIYHMIMQLPSEISKALYFSVATKADLFYAEELRSIPHLELHIHTTRESVEWCELGRVDVDSINADLDTEWYLCGNGKMIIEARDKLTERGFKNIYFEEFD